MRGPFGILLVGGGLILILGLFTGKITFPGAAPASGASVGSSLLGGATPAGNTPAMGNPTQPNGSPCPSGQVYSPYFKKCIAAPLIGGH